MADRRRNRKRPETQTQIDEVDKPQKMEYQIAKFLRSILPPKQTTLAGHKVDYFIASRAIDQLMSSKWAHADKRTDEVMFPSRESAAAFMNTMLRHKFFHRAKTIIVKKEIKKKQDSDSTDDCQKSDSKKSKATSGGDKPKSKEKKKIKLDMHMEQIFVDGNEPYVWIYDYISMKTWLIGGGLVFAAIAICLFPLWPRTVRNYVYYLSIAVAVFLFFIIGLALLKMVVFAIVWVVTMGKHHLWILPNLTEDVGFFESFWPLYKHDYKPGNKGEVMDTSKKSKPDKEKKTSEPEAVVEPDKDSEAESVSTNESLVRNNDFEILDSNECNETNEA